MISSLADAGDGRGGAAEVHVVEVSEAEEERSADSTEISPLLVDAGHKPTRINIFSVSYPRKRSPRELALRAPDMEFAVLYQIILWAWSGSRYSGLLCMASSATIYYIMEVLTEIFPVPPIPLFETVFARCTIVSILSVVWLRKTGQPLFAPAHIRILLITRSLSGIFSLLSFIYSIQRLPLGYALVLNFATPILASIGAKIILKENGTFPDIGGLVLSFLGVLFIFWPILSIPGGSNETDETSIRVSPRGSYPVYPILVAIFSSAMGGTSYCLIRAGTKASDQPVYTVLSFGVLASPIAAICTFTFQEFVLPNFFTFFMMVVLSILAFLAEITLARGLQLERISKVTNILFIKVTWQHLQATSNYHCYEKCKAVVHQDNAENVAMVMEFHVGVGVIGFMNLLPRRQIRELSYQGCENPLIPSHRWRR